eukprot:94529-Prymnesium_polylepis.3
MARQRLWKARYELTKRHAANARFSSMRLARGLRLLHSEDVIENLLLPGAKGASPRDLRLRNLIFHLAESKKKKKKPLIVPDPRIIPDAMSTWWRRESNP